MKLLQNAAAIVSLGFLAVGVYELWSLGLSETGAQALFVASFCALALSLSVYVFVLRGRIMALEKQSLGSR